MKPLVLWARWHDAKIQFHGRTPDEVWGELNYWKEERMVPFRFDLKEAILSTEDQQLKLDEAGVAITDQATPDPD